MIDYRLLQRIKNDLQKLIKNFPDLKENTFQPAQSALKFSSPSDIIINEIYELCNTLIPAYKPRKNITPLQKLEAEDELKELAPDSQDYYHYTKILTMYNYQMDYRELHQVNTIIQPIPDPLKLAILTHFFDNIAHLNNQTAATAYATKDEILKYLLKTLPDQTFAIPINSKHAGKTAVFFQLDDKFLSWHTLDDSLRSTELPESFYTLAQKMLSTSVKYKNTTLTRDNLAELFFNENFEEARIAAVMELDNHKNINNILEAKVNETEQEVNEDIPLDEFTGGGPYDIELEIENDTEPLSTNSVSEESTASQTIDETPSESISAPNEQIAPRDQQTLLDLILASSDEDIKKLLRLTNSNKVCYGLSISEIATMEIFQTAFEKGIITQDELTEQQLEILPALIESATKTDRVEIKSCGKDSELSKDWNLGKKFLVLRVQNNFAAKPILWEIQNDLTNILLEDYGDKIQKTSGRTLHSIENLSILEKLSPQKSKSLINSTTDISEEIPSVLSEDLPAESQETINSNTIQVPTFTGEIFDEFLNQPDSKEKLYQAAKNATPDQKAFLAAIFYQLDPGSFSFVMLSQNDSKSNRNGGMDRG